LTYPTYPTRFAALRLVPLVVVAKVQPGAGEVNRVLADLVTQQPPRRAVLVPRHGEAACQIAQPRDHDQRDLPLPFAPADPADLVVGDEARLRPDPVLVEAAADGQAHRKEIGVVEEHHRLAEHRPAQKDE